MSISVWVLQHLFGFLKFSQYFFSSSFVSVSCVPRNLRLPDTWFLDRWGTVLQISHNKHTSTLNPVLYQAFLRILSLHFQSSPSCQTTQGTQMKKTEHLQRSRHLKIFINIYGILNGVVRGWNQPGKEHLYLETDEKARWEAFLVGRESKWKELLEVGEEVWKQRAWDWLYSKKSTLVMAGKCEGRSTWWGRMILWTAFQLITCALGTPLSWVEYQMCYSPNVTELQLYFCLLLNMFRWGSS